MRGSAGIAEEAVGRGVEGVGGFETESSSGLGSF